MFGLARFLNLRKTEYGDSPLGTPWHEAWIFLPEEIIDPLASGSTQSHIGLFNYWLVSKDSSPVHAVAGAAYEEEWPSIDASARPSSPVAGVAATDCYAYFDQGRSKLIDDILFACGRKGVDVMLTVWGHTDLRDGGDWGQGWYGATGGWKQLAELRDFLEATSTGNPRVWRHQLNYYRYLVGRYSAMPGFGLWEVVSEYRGIQSTAQGLTGRNVPAEDGVRFAFMRRVEQQFRAMDPYGHPVSSASAGYTSNLQPSTYRAAHWLEGEYVSTHAYDVLRDAGVGINSQSVLALANNASFRKDVVEVAGQVPSDLAGRAPVRPWFHGEIGVYERTPTGTPLEVTTTGPYIFKGVTAFHYVLTSDLFRGAAGVPLRWNDAKAFGEMRHRTSAKSGVCDRFTAAKYPADYFAELVGHRKLVNALIARNVAPWQVLPGTGGRGTIPAKGGTAGMFMRSNAATACWLYRVTDGDPSGGNREINLTSYAPAGAAEYELTWVNPWTGKDLITDPGVTNLQVNYWDGRMEAVAPVGFDRRPKEDVVVVIEGK
jgi:hypothetical protein